MSVNIKDCIAWNNKWAHKCECTWNGNWFQIIQAFFMKFYLLIIIPVEGLIENGSHAHR